MRKLPFYPILVLLLIAVGGYQGCDPNAVPVPLSGGSRTNASSNPQLSEAIPVRTAANILIGSFNLRQFEKNKLSDAWLMEKLAAIMRCYDVIALQEISSQNQPAVDLLLNKVNELGAQYAYLASPPLGRTWNGIYDQYAFIYDTQRIQSGPNYVVRDEADIMHWEPFVGRFQTRARPDPFRFTLINVHIDPAALSTELDVLADVYISIRQFEYPEDDVMILGDLNAAPDRLQKLALIPAFVPLIINIPTTSRRNKTLDNILVDSQTTREFTGRAGTIDLDAMFTIGVEQAEKISDHLPIWAEFTALEQTAASTAMSSATRVLR